jgi:hypothetical protein
MQQVTTGKKENHIQMFLKDNAVLFISKIFTD